MGAYKFSTNYKSVDQRRQAGYSLSDFYLYLGCDQKKNR